MRHYPRRPALLSKKNHHRCWTSTTTTTALTVLLIVGWLMLLGNNHAVVAAFSACCTTDAYWTPRSSLSSSTKLSAAASATTSSSSWFPTETTSTAEQGITTTTTTTSKVQYKARLLQLGAALDRGQAYNPTSGEYYKDRMDVAISTIGEFVDTYGRDGIPKSLADICGEWELVLSTVPHGIFRSSPFFLAIQEAYEVYAEEKTIHFNKDKPPIGKADLFFKLHELQTCSWGASKVGRVAQHITENGYLYSTFDTSLFSLTVIPILGWFKLLPTFGGCVVTAATCQLATTPNSLDDKSSSSTTTTTKPGQLDMVVEYTTARKVPGLNGLGPWIWNIKVPVGAIWKLLPWNKGRPATCKVYIKYVDDDFRIVQDVSGDYFVYTRPVVPRELDLAVEQEGQ